MADRWVVVLARRRCTFAAYPWLACLLCRLFVHQLNLLYLNLQAPALLPLAAYPFLAVCDVYCIYRELKAVQLRTLNRERAELVAEQWVKLGKVPPTEEVSLS